MHAVLVEVVQEQTLLHRLLGEVHALYICDWRCTCTCIYMYVHMHVHVSPGVGA